MTSSPTFSPAAETTTPPPTSGPAAPRPSPPGPTSPASPWRHNHAYRRASLSQSRFRSICRCQVDGALPSYSAATASTFVSLGNDDYPQRTAVCSTVSECRSVPLGTEFGLPEQAHQPVSLKSVIT